MLELAQKYKEVLESKFLDTWENEKYWYYNCYSYFSKKELDDTTWSRMQYVSVSPKGEVIGYLGYSLERESRYVNGLEIINFTDNPQFGLDVCHMIREIFEKYHYRKIEFTVIVGNPIEQKYDRLIARYGGRIVGTYHERVILPDGKLYDEKLYEIFRKDYLSNRKKRKESLIMNDKEL